MMLYAITETGLSYCVSWYLHTNAHRSTPVQKWGYAGTSSPTEASSRYRDAGTTRHLPVLNRGYAGTRRHVPVCSSPPDPLQLLRQYRSDPSPARCGQPGCG
eukprot:2292471-Rhodomonas_salina.1